MNTASGRRGELKKSGGGRVPLMFLWLALTTGWLVSIFSVIEEMCMVSACRDTTGFTVFGYNMGWFGIAYFSLILMALWLRKKDSRMDWLLSALIFSAIGAEFRLLWIQKYVIGGWCPLCVTICCALFVAGLLLLIEKVRMTAAGQEHVKGLLVWLALMVATAAIGLASAVTGVKALY